MFFPSENHASRNTSILSASIAIIASVIGGGVLSLPFAFASAGVLPTLFMILLATAMAVFSLYILCSCSRRTGAKSYSDVVKEAFGVSAELSLSAMLFIFLLVLIVAFMILMRDINTSLYRLIAPTSTQPPSVILGFSVALTFPFMMSHNLRSLRYNCYVGIVSVFLLTLALFYRCVQYNIFTEKPFEKFGEEVLWSTSNPMDALFTFPLIALAFLSQFNILSVHSSLANPTRTRLLAVIYTAIIPCAFLFAFFGLFGYLCFYGATSDNILLNFPPDDPVILLGRVGLCATLLAGVPLIVIPCRDVGGDLPRQVKKMWEERGRVREYSISDLGGLESSEGSGKGEETSLLHEVGSDSSKDEESYNSTGETDNDIFSNDDYDHDDEVKDAPLHTVREEEDKFDVEALNDDSDKETNSRAHFIKTFAIALPCYVSAVYCPGVSSVWSICGSSLGFMIAYILPSACYLKLRSKRKGNFNLRMGCAWVMLIFSLIGCVACTSQAVYRLVGNERGKIVANESSSAYEGE